MKRSAAAVALTRPTKHGINSAHEAALAHERCLFGRYFVQDEWRIRVGNDLPQVIAADDQPLVPMIALWSEDTDESGHFVVLAVPGLAA